MLWARLLYQQILIDMFSLLRSAERLALPEGFLKSQDYKFGNIELDFKFLAS